MKFAIQRYKDENTEVEFKDAHKETLYWFDSHKRNWKTIEKYVIYIESLEELLDLAKKTNPEQLNVVVGNWYYETPDFQNQIYVLEINDLWMVGEY